MRLVVCLALCCVACGGSEETHESAKTYPYAVPSGFPLPSVVADNPVTDAKVALGRALFYDERLSLNQTQSCGTCHKQALAFTDGLAHAVGSTGEHHPRGAQTLANVAYATSFTWANNVLSDLERQALVPMFNDSPVELGFNGQESTLISRLSATASYPSMFAAAFPDAEISLDTITKALASFERTLISGSSPYDRYLAGDGAAMSESAVRGEALFFGEVFECHHCHGSFAMTDAVTFDGDKFPAQPFHNNALYNVDGNGAYPVGNQGLIEITGVATDMGRFKAPSLRNIAVTAPYMHDGSIATLEDVIAHYVAGGRTVSEGPNAGVGATSPLRDPLIRAFIASAQDKADVIAFLEALTDDAFLADPAFSDPGEIQ